MRRRQLLLSSLAVSVTSPLMHSLSWAQSAFPKRPLTLVVPWPAGGATDVTSRAIAEALSQELGQSTIVENRAGANGAIGLAYVSRAAQDGYTLATTTADTHSINPHLRSDLAYDAVNGFDHLAVYSTIYWAWMTRPDFPANNVQQLIALAKQKPGQITYGSWGIGSSAHIAGALLESALGIQLNHVPFPGSAPAQAAIQGGHIDLLPLGRVSAENLHKAGKVKIIATSAPTRSKTVLPQIPTLGEQGFPNAQAGSWYGISIRSGVPESIRNRLQDAIVKVLSTPEMTSRIARTGMDPVILHGNEMKQFLRSQYDHYGAVIRQKNIKVT